MNAAMLTDEGEQRRVDEARSWLEKVRKAVGYARRLEASAKASYQRADGLKGIDYSKPFVKSSPYADAIPDAIAADEAIGDTLSAIAADARDKVDEASRAIHRLDDKTEATCLHLYYVDAYDTWERVCVEMGYSYDGMMKLSRRALLHAYDVMPHGERSPMQPAI